MIDGSLSQINPPNAFLNTGTERSSLHTVTVTSVRIDARKAGIIARIKTEWNRFVYFIKNLGYYSLIGMPQSYVLNNKHDDVENFINSWSSSVRIGSETIGDGKGDGKDCVIGPHLLEPGKEGKRFLQFELATMHGGFWQELHNISVLVDRESTPPHIYILDGKGQNPEEAFLTMLQPGREVKSKNTVKDFINLLTIGTEAEVAYINTPLQRRMDCVIFPLVVRNRLVEQIKDKGSTLTSAKDVLETTLNNSLEDPRTFYGEINALRDRWLSSAT